MGSDACFLGDQPGEAGLSRGQRVLKVGREFTRPVIEFGECVWCAPATSAGKENFDVRWKVGVWLGVGS